MDLLDATQKERAAVLDYSDAQALVSYHNYLRERQGLVPLAIETDLAGTLGILASLKFRFRQPRNDFTLSPDTLPPSRFRS